MTEQVVVVDGTFPERAAFAEATLPRNNAQAVLAHKIQQYTAPGSSTRPSQSPIDHLPELSSQKVIEEVARHYVFCEDMASALSRGLRTGKNVLLYGPTGHAKSAVVRHLIEAMGLEDQTFIQDFGEGTDEASIWGGFDFHRMRVDDILDYQPERSFLNKEIAVFEELFDAPPNVLCSLKNTLTAKCLQKGADPYPSKNRIIIALTNKNPDEISALGESYKALVDRFPLRLKVDWPAYTSAEYGSMLERLGIGDAPFQKQFGEIAARCSAGGNIVSPRTVVHAAHIVLDAAREYGQLDERALAELAFIPGLEKVGKDELKKWREKIEELRYGTDTEDFRKLLRLSREAATKSSSIDELWQLNDALEQAQAELQNYKVPKKFEIDSQKLVKEITQAAEELQAKANELQRVLRINSRSGASAAPSAATGHVRGGL